MEREEDTQRRGPGKDRGRDQSDDTTSQGQPGTARNQQELQEVGTGCLLATAAGTGPCSFISVFQPPELTDDKFLLF